MMGGAPMMGQPGAFPPGMPMFPPGMTPMSGIAGPMPAGMPGMSGMMMGMPQGLPMGGMTMNNFPMGGLSMSQFGIPRGARLSVKEHEFEKGLFVEDFEETVTGEMLFKHFNQIKPVSIIKFPTNFNRHSQKIAFVYFRTAEDAKEVR